MKSKLNEMPLPSKEVLTEMIENLKNVNAAVIKNINGKEANDLNNNRYFLKNLNQEWLSTLPSSLHEERDEIINLMIKLAETVATDSNKKAFDIIGYAAGIRTQNQNISLRISTLLREYKAMSIVAGDGFTSKKERKPSTIAILVIIYIVFKIARAIFNNS